MAKIDIAPNVKLSKDQRRVMLGRVLEQSTRPKALAGAPMGIPSGMPGAESMASGIAGDRMPMPTGMPVSDSGLNAMAMPTSMNPQDVVGDPASALMGRGTPWQDPGTQPPLPNQNVLSPAEEHIQSALIADQLWRDGGGAGSIGGQIWKKLKQDSKGNHLDSARDYFISSFVKWKRDPEKFEKNHPREANLIRQLNDEFDASQSIPDGPPLTTLTSGGTPNGLIG